MNFRSYNDLTTCLVKNINRIPHDIDLILGIPRSGTMVANILALYLNVPFMDLYSFLNRGEFHTGTTRKSKRWISTPQKAKHILLVDDSVSSGKAIGEAKALIEEFGYNEKLTTLAVYVLGLTKNKVDIYFEICEQPRMFEWNFMHHWALEYCCVDIDGVLCEDPRIIQNDDGKRYLKFLESAEPKFIPTQKVGKLVSCRLDKYRPQTEAWLKRHSVEYDELIMVKGIDAKERAVSFNHGEYKGKIYKESSCILFIESDYDQALTICRVSGKPVFCIENRELVDDSNVIEKIAVRQKEMSVTLRRVVKKILGKINYVK